MFGFCPWAVFVSHSESCRAWPSWPLCIKFKTGLKPWPQPFGDCWVNICPYVLQLKCKVGVEKWKTSLLDELHSLDLFSHYKSRSRWVQALCSFGKQHYRSAYVVINSSFWLQLDKILPQTSQCGSLYRGLYWVWGHGVKCGWALHCLAKSFVQDCVYWLQITVSACWQGNGLIRLVRMQQLHSCFGKRRVGWGAWKRGQRQGQKGHLGSAEQSTIKILVWPQAHSVWSLCLGTT